jgi:hypothetical protein
MGFISLIIYLEVSLGRDFKEFMQLFQVLIFYLKIIISFVIR